MFIECVVGVLGGQAEAHPLLAIALEQFDVLGRQRGGQGAGVHLRLHGLADFRQADVFVAAVEGGLLGGEGGQRHQGEQGNQGFQRSISWLRGYVSRTGRTANGS
ncbi:hypothetical protein D9M69_601900 [compost metagenome]